MCHLITVGKMYVIEIPAGKMSVGKGKMFFDHETWNQFEGSATRWKV
jgi:hypothetical protein